VTGACSGSDKDRGINNFMKIFHCDHCQQLLFFENTHCIQCGHALAYLPDVADLVSLEPKGDNLWQSLGGARGGRTYRLCQHYSQGNCCNWAIPADDPNPLCRSCRLTRVFPDLKQSGNAEAWQSLETAKRRLIYSLLGLGLPLSNKMEDPECGLAFEFLADSGVPGADPVLTGHNEGVIVVNVAEADDVERERRRHQMHEPYRTLLGHFRHEIGHYYWDRLIQSSDKIEGFRQLFGDEREDYNQALERYYQAGPAADWQQHFVSAYASSHPWEDWAETWAHYLHMIDALEMTTTCGLSLQPDRPDEPALHPDLVWHGGRPKSFECMIASWFSLAYILNNLNRGLGLQDAYPFVLSTPAIEKLRFVHEIHEPLSRDQASAGIGNACAHRV